MRCSYLGWLPGSRRNRAFMVLASFLCLGIAKPAAAQLSDLIKKAAAEKEIIFQISEPRGKYSTAQVEQQLSDLVQKRFGVEVNIKFNFALSFPAAAARTLTEIKTGSYPSYDLMYQTTGTAIGLYRGNTIHPVRWRELFNWINEKELSYGGQAIVVSTTFLLPVYNTNLVKPADVPKTWDELLDAKWKGKLAAPIYQDMWPNMAQSEVWGEPRTREFLRKISLQNPVLGRFPEIEAKVISGEVPAAVVTNTYSVEHYRAKGAPIAYANVEPVIVFVRLAFVPKNALRPSAATLVASTLLTPEGQTILADGWAASSLFQPNTPAAKFAAGRKLALPNVDFEKEKGLALQKEYERIIVKR